MSWIVALAAPASSPLHARARALCPLDAVRHADGRVWIAADGPETTCLTGALAGPWRGFAVVGIGLAGTAHVRALDAAAWAHRLAQQVPPLDDLDGHFAVLRWDDGRFEVVTDPTALRTGFVRQAGDGVVFSTHLERVLALTGPARLDVAAAASAWHLQNQMIPRCMAAGVTRLAGGTTLRAEADGFAVKGEAWRPAPADEPVESVLRRHLRAALPGNRQPSLGLSGGLDSRLLLALAPEATALHVFGDPDHPDAEVAGVLARRTGRPLRHLHAPLPDAAACWDAMQRFAVETHGTAPASAALHRRFYGTLDADGRAVVDGGFGEIGRRQYFNRLRLLGPAALRRGDASALVPYLRVPRPAVFAPEVEAHMEAAIAAEVADLIGGDLRAAAEPLEQRLDRLSIRARLASYAFEQTRLDAHAVCVMPYAQPSLLRSVLGTPLAERRGGRLYRRLIRTHAPALARVPLVKGTRPYPFALGPVGAALWTRATGRWQTPYAMAEREAVLRRVEPFVRDHLGSRALREGGLYDLPALDALIGGFYARGEGAAAFDGWLAFELWRSGLGLS